MQQRLQTFHRAWSRPDPDTARHQGSLATFRRTGLGGGGAVDLTHGYSAVKDAVKLGTLIPHTSGAPRPLGMGKPDHHKQSSSLKRAVSLLSRHVGSRLGCSLARTVHPARCRSYATNTWRTRLECLAPEPTASSRRTASARKASSPRPRAPGITSACTTAYSPASPVCVTSISRVLAPAQPNLE